MKEKHKDKVGCKEKISHFEKVYNRYCMYRHTYFHWNDFKRDIDTTSMISDISVAKSHNFDVIKLIDSYYSN